MARLARLATLLVAVAGALALARPAVAAPPPVFNDPGNGEWVAFTIEADTRLTAPRGIPKWGPVTLVRHGTVTDVASTLGPWETDPLVPGSLFWPQTWSASGYTLERAVPKEACPATASSCSYHIVSGGGPFEVHAGGPLPIGQTFPPPVTFTLVEPLPADISVQIAQDLKPVQGTQGQAGTITLDASGTTDGPFSGDDLIYEWTVTGNGFTVHASGQVATVELAADGQYTVTLSVTNPIDGHTTTVSGTFAVTGVAPEAPGPEPGPPPGPAPAPAPSPAPSPAPGPSASPPAAGVPTEVAEAHAVVFAPPRNIPPALFGGRRGEAQVIWLWRPEWAAPTRGPVKPQTKSPPIVRAREEISLGETGPAPETNPAPWLAGLAAFGLLGAGWLFIRHRRTRAEL